MSERRRRRTLAVEPVRYDPDRTPRQSGSFEIMRDACTMTIDRLVSWGDSRLLSTDRETRQAAEAAIALAQEVSTLLATIETWPSREPSQEAKTATINEVLRLREAAGQLLKRQGATL